MKSISKAFEQYFWNSYYAATDHAQKSYSPEEELLSAAANERMPEFFKLLDGNVDIKKFEAKQYIIRLIANAGCDAAIWIADHSQQWGIGLNRRDTYIWTDKEATHERMGIVGHLDTEDRLHWQHGKYLRNTALILSVKKGWDHISDTYRYDKDIPARERRLKTRMGLVTSALLRNGANPDIQDGCGNTALHIAALHRDLRPLQALKDAGARNDIRNNAGLLPSDVLDVAYDDINPFLYQQTGNDVNCYIFTLQNRKDWLRAGAEVCKELKNWLKPAAVTRQNLPKLEL